MGIFDKRSKIHFGFWEISNGRNILFFFSCLFRATAMAYGGSQARGLIRAVAAGLNHSHNNARSKPHLRPTPQLMATPDR